MRVAMRRSMMTTSNEFDWRMRGATHEMGDVALVRSLRQAWRAFNSKQRMERRGGCVTCNIRPNRWCFVVNLRTTGVGSLPQPLVCLREVVTVLRSSGTNRLPSNPAGAPWRVCWKSMSFWQDASVHEAGLHKPPIQLRSWKGNAADWQWGKLHSNEYSSILS